MTQTNQKNEILRSLNNLDAVQAEKVLHFIQGLIRSNPNNPNHQRLKRQAMKEISQALGQSRQPNSSF